MPSNLYVTILNSWKQGRHRTSSARRWPNTCRHRTVHLPPHSVHLLRSLLVQALGPRSASQGRTLPYRGFQRVWVTANTRLTQDSAPGFQTTSVRSTLSHQDTPAHHPSQGNLGSLLCDARTAPSISLPGPFSFSLTRINHLKLSPVGVLPDAGPLSRAMGPLVSSRPHWRLVKSALSTALGARWAIQRHQAGPRPTSTFVKTWC